ncbi:MAG: hypothetical protein ACHQQ3_09320 [Gemmatimonadales bacterium]
MPRLSTTIATVALLAGPAMLSSQALTVDVHGAVATPVKKLSDANLDTGVGFGATLAVRLLPHFHGYAGWDWMHFPASRMAVGSDNDVDEVGYVAGFRFEHLLSARLPITYRIEAGETYKHMEIENTGGTITFDSGHGFGSEFGAGALVALAARWQLTAMLHYHLLERDITTRGRTSASDLRYVALEIGLARRF